MQQQHALHSHKLAGHLADAVCFNDLMGNGSGGELKIHAFKELKDLKVWSFVELNIMLLKE